MYRVLRVAISWPITMATSASLEFQLVQDAGVKRDFSTRQRR
jgi:hypothetical protein